MNISALLLRSSNPECGTVASLHFDGAKRHKGFGVTVPRSGWDRKRQRLKVSTTLHCDERTRLMALMVPGGNVETFFEGVSQ